MTKTFEKLNVFVNGIQQRHVSVRLSSQDGFPCGPKQLVADDPLVGEIVVTDDCILEFQWDGGPTHLARVPDLVELLEKLATTNGELV